MVAMTRLNRTWRSNTIRFASQFKLYKSPVTSILLYDFETWTLLADSENKDPGFRNHVPEETSPHLLLGAQDQRLRKTNSLVGPQEPLMVTVKRRKLAWSGHVTRNNSSPPLPPKKKKSFRAPWRVGDAVVGRGNARWTVPKSGTPCPCQNCSQGPPAEKTGRGSLLNRPSCPLDDPIGQRIEMN